MLARYIIYTVCPSQARIVSKVYKTAKHRIAQPTPYMDSSFLMPKISAKIRWGSPQRLPQIQVEWFEMAIFDQYLAISHASY